MHHIGIDAKFYFNLVCMEKFNKVIKFALSLYLLTIIL